VLQKELNTESISLEISGANSSEQREEIMQQLQQQQRLH
jgi:hypothetical protein